MAVILYSNNTATSAVNPSTSATPVNIYSRVIPYEGQNLVWVNVELSIEQTATSQTQTLTINLKVGATTKAYTFKTLALTAHANYSINSLDIVVPCRESTTVTVEIAQAGANDAQTSIIGKSLTVVGL